MERYGQFYRLYGKKMSSITARTISILFGKAAGRCSICNTPVVERDVKIGEMAHIIAKKKDGARGKLPFEGDINGYENLILLCPNHHAEVDDNEAIYPPARLHQIKNEHERYVQNLFEQESKARTMDIAGLRALMMFLPFTQIFAMTNSLPNRFDHRIYYLSETFENFAKDNPQCRPFGDSDLEVHYAAFCRDVMALIRYEQYATINDKNVFLPGHLVELDVNFSYINRDLDWEERSKAHSDIQELLRDLASTYYPFIEYLRRCYPEVNLASFVGW
ncbi:HNH endonuclease signature motif containing protein [Burkholderia cepacia]|uniref:HNH endonuclease signature motif containing protein n=1 Tax=Burkholderia cepacia TaxID=292 RepID=UPI0012D90D96|nr:HNH endonuclease signature motif containing protein [Burkholderia cepacia]